MLGHAKTMWDWIGRISDQWGRAGTVLAVIGVLAGAVAVLKKWFGTVGAVVIVGSVVLIVVGVALMLVGRHQAKNRTKGPESRGMAAALSGTGQVTKTFVPGPNNPASPFIAWDTSNEHARHLEIGCRPRTLRVIAPQVQIVDHVPVKVRCGKGTVTFTQFTDTGFAVDERKTSGDEMRVEYYCEEHALPTPGPPFERKEQSHITDEGQVTAWEEIRRGQDATITPRTVEAKADIPAPAVNEVSGPQSGWKATCAIAAPERGFGVLLTLFGSPDRIATEVICRVFHGTEGDYVDPKPPFADQRQGNRFSLRYPTDFVDPPALAQKLNPYRAVWIGNLGTELEPRPEMLDQTSFSVDPLGMPVCGGVEEASGVD